jgi:hypothetical protein
MSRILRCKGWTDGAEVSSGGDIEVGIGGICACKQHAECKVRQKCERLFSDGGAWGADKTLAELMKADGKRMPKSWRDWFRKTGNIRWVIYDAIEAAMSEFEKMAFLKCKPVVVEIRRRKE